jgi:integrase
LGELDRWGNPRGVPKGGDPRYEFAEYARAMITGKRTLARTTKALYLRTIRVHIKGTAIGEGDVRYITPSELNAWWGKLEAGNGALGNIHEVLSKAFRRAQREELRTDNPLERAEDVKKPRRRARDVQPLRTEEVEALADHAAVPRDRLEVLVMAYGGLRAGEVGGLRTSDIDWERGQLHIKQQVRRITGDGLETAELKTKAARRIVTLPRSVMDELRAFVDEHPPAKDGRVFHGQNGSMRDSVRINAGVQRSAKRAGVETHAHALRHTAVSMWVADGASPVDVQHMVGHSRIEGTLGIYAHLFHKGGADLAARMEKRREAHKNGGAK